MEYHCRKTLRLPTYDYSENGAYFLTICTQDKRCLFWNGPEAILNAGGRMVGIWIEKLPEKYPGVWVDSYAIMPNHVHILLHFQNTQAKLQAVMDWFKTMTTNAYIRMVKEGNVPSFDKRVWQRSYYEHVVRNDVDLSEIQTYIQNNPLKWQLDRFYRE